MSRLGQSKGLWGVYVLLTSGIFVRLWRLPARSLWLDEANGLRVMSLGFEQLRDGRGEGYHPPLYYEILRIWTEIFGTSEWSLRLISAFCACLSLALIYTIAHQLFSKPAATWALLFSAFSPMLVWYGQEARPYSIVIFLHLLGIWGLLQALERNYLWGWFVFTISFTLAIYTHYLAILILPIQLLLVTYVIAKRRTTALNGGVYFIALICALALFLPWTQTEAMSIFWSILNSDQSYIATLFAQQGISFDIVRLGLAIAAPIGLLGLVWLTRLWVRQEKAITQWSERQSWLVYLLIFFLFALSIAEAYPRAYSIKRQLVTIYPICLILLGWILSWRRPISSYLQKGVIAVLLLILLGQQFLIPKAEWRDTAIYLEENVQENDLIILSPSYMEIPLTYYDQDLNIYDPQTYSGSTDNATQRVWYIVQTQDPAGNSEGFVQQWGENGRILSQQSYYLIDITLYETP